MLVDGAIVALFAGDGETHDRLVRGPRSNSPPVLMSWCWPQASMARRWRQCLSSNAHADPFQPAPGAAADRSLAGSSAEISLWDMLTTCPTFNVIKNHAEECAMTRTDEIAVKEDRIRKTLARLGFDSLILTRRVNFAWITVGDPRRLVLRRAGQPGLPSLYSAAANTPSATALT